MARKKEDPGIRGGEADADVDAALADAADPGEPAGEARGRPGASRWRTRPLWDDVVETGINGYRGSGG